MANQLLSYMHNHVWVEAISITKFLSDLTALCDTEHGCFSIKDGKQLGIYQVSELAARQQQNPSPGCCSIKDGKELGIGGRTLQKGDDQGVDQGCG